MHREEAADGQTDGQDQHHGSRVLLLRALFLRQRVDGEVVTELTAEGTDAVVAAAAATALLGLSARALGLSAHVGAVSALLRWCVVEFAHGTVPVSG